MKRRRAWSEHRPRSPRANGFQVMDGPGQDSVPFEPPFTMTPSLRGSTYLSWIAFLNDPRVVDDTLGTRHRRHCCSQPFEKKTSARDGVTNISEHREFDHVGINLRFGLVKIFPRRPRPVVGPGEIRLTVVRRSQIIRECALGRQALPLRYRGRCY